MPVRRGTSHRDDSGFTLLELMVAMLIFGVLVGIADWTLTAYNKAQAERGSANTLLGALRDAAEQAQSEGRTYCVRFDSATSWSLWQYSCSPVKDANGITGAQVGATNQLTNGVSTSGFAITTPTLPGLASACPATSSACVYFYPRGISSSGSVHVQRSGSSKTYTLSVEGLTSHVSLA